MSIPGLGYWFGGSRFLSEYNDKPWANQDCSSAVAKWTQASEPFTTVSILNINDSSKKTSYDLAAKAILKPVEEPFAGAIFCKKGHCGVVKEYQPEDNKIKVISFTRMMPVSEGLIEQNYDLRTVGNQYQTKVDIDYHRLDNLVQSYYGFDNEKSKFISEFKDTYFYQPIDPVIV